jgi:hypothetical protein
MRRADRAGTGDVVVRLSLQLCLPDEVGATVAATLSYRAADPYAVDVTFHTATGDVRWVFARELLADGLHRPSGEGDVRVTPAGRAALVTLSSPDGIATLRVNRRSLAVFVERTHRLVPPGHEGDHLDLDAAVAALVA